MTHVPTPDDRLDALERRVALQETVIDDLNRVVTDQWGAIDGLKRLLDQVRERLEEAETRAGAPPAAQRPPHY